MLGFGLGKDHKVIYAEVLESTEDLPDFEAIAKKVK